MLIRIPDVLTPEQVAHARQLLDQADWVDGRVTAGHQSSKAKDNMQLPENSPVARELGDLILAALGKNPDPRNTMAANSAWKTPTACSA